MKPLPFGPLLGGPPLFAPRAPLGGQPRAERVHGAVSPEACAKHARQGSDEPLRLPSCSSNYTLN